MNNYVNSKLAGNRIKEYLAHHGIRQNYLANESGIPKKTINDIVNGRVKISIDWLQKICTVLNLPVTYFLTSKSEEIGKNT